MKHPRTFPVTCPRCQHNEVPFVDIVYMFNHYIGALGTEHQITIPKLTLRVCKQCGEKIFDVAADEQIHKAIEQYETKALT